MDGSIDSARPPALVLVVALVLVFVGSVRA